MSFFGKMKNRLFKSSSKLDEGLEAIVGEGGEEDEAPSEPPRSAEQERAVQTAPESPGETPAPTPPAPDTPAPDTPTEVPPAPEPDLPQEPQPVPEPDLPPRTPPEPEVPPNPAPEPTPGPDIPGNSPVEMPQQAPQEMPARNPDPMPTPAPLEIPVEAPQEVPARSTGLLNRLLGRREDRIVVRRALDDDMLESLEELLIASDMGVDTSLRVTANMAEGRMGRKLSVPEIKQLLSDEITRIMDPVARPMPLYPSKPQVVLVVGVNGSGKTTTIGKLASQFRAAGKSVVIAAGDTFRAAAVEQLQVWGDRAGVPVLTAPEGSDPASLAFDAMTKAQADGADLLMIDTAGRLQNRADLMEELSKIVRVIRKKDPDAPHNTLLVLDATTGQNALSQVETFRKLADVSGLVMTKLDGTAKGGVLVALADKFGLPIHAIGVGEQIDDLAPFDPEDFAAALTGLDRA
ncbi:signal recognition particle-docking protein FtsY [Primorskyibacter marinus]|uniref:signal recognition particle-docking protein FtsY n=1 Tax=Primorskyibacter marinus TaxID=1977320 RepID=UPI000E301A90|nr:signal recognition particle-docking protein FtsY [Primorskyibacter marinus]